MRGMEREWRTQDVVYVLLLHYGFPLCTYGFGRLFPPYVCLQCPINGLAVLAIVFWVQCPVQTLAEILSW